MDLVQRCGDADMRVEFTPRSSDQVNRNRKRVVRVSRFEGVDPRLDRVRQSGI